MTTEKQIIANRQNAQLGGVKTEKGKAVSKLNAIKHGILSSLVTPDEEQEAHKVFRALVQDYTPQTATEEILIERITLWIIRLRRAANAEKDQFLKILNPRIVKPDPTFAFLLPKEDVIQEGYSPKVSSSDVQTLDNIYLRYETSLERNLYKALHELQRIQATRSGHSVPPPLAIDVNLDNSSEQKEGQNGFVS